MMYRVIYSKPGSDNREIGEFDSLEDAVAAATQAGGVYDDNATEAQARHALLQSCWDVQGHSDHGIWVEEVR